MNSKKTTVSLEDLLRVKRAERPPPEFWAQFDREMRVKQLAAIIEPRPWWAPFIKVGARVSRYQLPIGAAAILALSFVTIREYRTSEINSGYLPEIGQEISRVESASPSTATALPSAAPSERQLDDLALSAPIEVTPEPATGRSSHVVPLAEPAAPPAEPTPSARYIAANLAAAQAANPGLIDEVFGAAPRRAELREPVRDPLAQISSPGESRRSRLLASALPAMANSSDVSIGSSDRVARRLTEERLYDSISRVGVQGDRVAIKF